MRSIVIALLCACGDVREVTDGRPSVLGPPPPFVAPPLVDSLGPIVDIKVTPKSLTPAFAVGTHDYYVSCEVGHNALTFDVTYARGTTTTAVTLVEDQAYVVGDYWVRCLPSDFPRITVTTHADVGAPTPGYYLVDDARYAIALDTNGTPVWYARGTNIADVDSLAQNQISLMPAASGPINDDPLQAFELHTLNTGTQSKVLAVGSPTDEHDLQRMPNGDWLVFTYRIITNVNLTSLGFGSSANLADCIIQELDSANTVVWSWRASDHVDAIQESVEPIVEAFGGMNVIDAFHCNSVDVTADGATLLLSLREANALYAIDHATGTVRWKLGGTTFNKDGATHIAVVSDPHGPFNEQHDARFRPSGSITLFDDHGATAGVARAVEYAIDLDVGTATPVWEALGVSQSLAMGSVRRSADGHTVIGWGIHPPSTLVLSEVDAAGASVLDVSFAGGASYRAVKVPLSQLDIGLMRTHIDE